MGQDSVEQDSIEPGELGWIPRAVRDKLDQVGIKLHLQEWQAFSLEERRELYALPCQTSIERQIFIERLDALTLQHCGALPRRLSQ